MEPEKKTSDRLDGQLSNKSYVSSGTAVTGLREGNTRVRPRPRPLNLRRTPKFCDEVDFMDDAPIAMAESQEGSNDNGIERGMARVALGAKENRQQPPRLNTTTPFPSFTENDRVMSPDEYRPYTSRPGTLLKTRSMTSAELKAVSVIPTEQIHAMAEELKASEPPLTLGEARKRRATLKQEEEAKEEEKKKENLKIRREAVAFLRTRAKERAAAKGVELHLPPSPGSRKKENLGDKAPRNA